MYSEDPHSRAILEEAILKLGNSFRTPDESEIITGQGMKVKVGENTILVGNRKLMNQSGIEIPDEVNKYLESEESEGQTGVILGDLQKVLGVISIAGTITGDIDKVVMLAGDNIHVAAAKKVGLDDYYAELLPADKVSILKKLPDILELQQYIVKW